MIHYALKHSISQVESELREANLNPSAFTHNDIIMWAMMNIHIDELKQINENLDRLTITVNRVAGNL